MKTAKGSLLLRIPVMILGSSMIAVGVYFFKIPNGFSTGGVSGISTVLGKAIPNAYVTPGTLITAINVLLLIIGFFVVGKSFSVRTVFCSLLFSLETLGLEKWIPLDQPITNQPFLELVYAILLTSIGSSILFYVNASSGGTDIVALILKKYTRLDTGKALLCTDFLIAGSAFFVFGVTAGLQVLSDRDREARRDQPPYHREDGSYDHHPRRDGRLFPRSQTHARNRLPKDRGHPASPRGP